MSKENNFDLIRLVAALQVMLVHGLAHLGLNGSVVVQAVEFLPGVPIFFFVSGFLISASYARSRSLGQYARNRALRIFPALWFATILGVLSAYLTGYLSTVEVSAAQFTAWLIGQSTVAQFFNPDFMRGYGTGVLNGSLWTITVELQFYFLMPLAALVLARSQRLFGLALVVFVLIGTTYTSFLLPHAGAAIVSKLMQVTFLPWFGMFLTGVFAQAYWPTIRPWVEGRFLLWLVVYAAATFVGFVIEAKTGVELSGNRISFLLFLPLAALVLSTAFSAPALANRLFHRNDISYGLYVFHMPVINAWLYLALPQTYAGLVACLIVTTMLATLSWFAVEKPALHRKPKTLLRGAQPAE